MRILHVFDLFSPHGGGTVDLLYKLSRAQAQRGHEVVIYASDHRIVPEYIASLPEVRVYPFHCISSFAGFYIMQGIITAVRNNLKSFDIIHLHCFRSFQNIVVRHYATKNGVSYVLDTHGSLPRTSYSKRSLKRLVKWLFDITFGYRILRDASRVIAENEFGVREYQELGIKQEKVAVIPLFFPVEEFSDLPATGQFRDRHGIKEKYIIMSLGRIHWIKGLDFLVESFAELAGSRKDVFLVIAGSDDGYKSTLDKQIDRLHLTDRVLFPGFLGGQDKLAALADVDIVIQPSRYEQAAWAPIEAVLCGTPIIVSRDSGAGEDVTRMNAGYLVEYGNKRQMVEIIESIIENPAEARTRVQKAAEYIKANLTLSTKVEEYERLYRECIPQKEPDRSKK